MIERDFVSDAKVILFIKEYLRKRLRDALISKIEVIKTPLITRIVIYAAKPGLVIGKKGARIKEVTEEIKKKFNLNNPQIEVVPVENPILDAQVQAERIALAIERGMAWRPLLNSTLRRIMEAGAQGAELVVKGKLGARNARAQKGRVYAGYMKKVGDPAKL
ncbi:MAG: 30S ribosomal protein S3, partial [Candidatus Diapherotrites archaeon]|nr:30S ribosomal protein S3 [Candidatus Diapherotrites archaeon]